MLIKDELFGKEAYLNEEQYAALKTGEGAISIAFYLSIALIFLTFTSVWIVLFLFFLYLTHTIYNNSENPTPDWTKWDFMKIACYQANKITVGFFMIPLLPLIIGYVLFHYNFNLGQWEGPYFTFNDIPWIISNNRYTFLFWAIITGLSAWLGSLLVSDSIQTYLAQVSEPKENIITYSKWATIIFTVSVEIIAFFDGQFASTLRSLEIALGKLLLSVVYLVGHEIEYIIG